MNYYGFGLAKTTIASSYLPLTPGGNFITVFSGNPFTGTGGLSGCVVPAIVNAGNDFLWTTGSSLRARDASFSSIQNIKDRLFNGQPVEVWIPSLEGTQVVDMQCSFIMDIVMAFGEATML